jgi:hypothetical protein
MNRLICALAASVASAAVLAAVAFADAPNGTSSVCPRPSSWPSWAGGCLVSLTATGPSPSRIEMPAGSELYFANPDSVPHTVVFADGRCSLTLAPGEGFDRWNRVGPNWDCADWSSFYVGNSAYTVDGKFSGTVETTPVHRVVTLTARTHTIRRGTRVTLQGQVSPPGWRHPVSSPPGWRCYVSVVILARHDSKHPFRPICHPQPGPDDKRSRQLAPAMAAHGASRHSDHLHRQGDKPTPTRTDLDQRYKSPLRGPDPALEAQTRHSRAPVRGNVA